MSKVLTNPVQSVELNRERIANIEAEDNWFSGRSWFDVWIVLGRLTDPDDESTFEERPYQNLNEALGFHQGKEARQVRFQKGVHPLRSNMALGRCDECGKWYAAAPLGNKSIDCEEDGCDGTVEAYDPISDILDAWNAFKASVYAKLMAEEVPNPDDFEQTVKLMDASDPE